MTRWFIDNNYILTVETTDEEFLDRYEQYHHGSIHQSNDNRVRYFSTRRNNSILDHVQELTCEEYQIDVPVVKIIDLRLFI